MFEVVLSGVDGAPPGIAGSSENRATLQKTPPQGEFEHVAATV